MKHAGIYIHVPFCGQKCPYCDFYSMPAGRTMQKAYTEAVLRDLSSYRGKNISADTLYFGGGTPSLLKTEYMEALLEAVCETFSLPEEITLEANPGTVDFQKLKDLRAMGFNRISFGLQSARAEELEVLGRIHSAEDARQAVLLAREAGFENISLDLMLGVPKQTLDTVDVSLDFVRELAPEHISAYLLKIEPGTPFYRQEIFDLLPDTDTTCDIYLKVCDELRKMGLMQYEISNFARPGKESIHNLKYWNREDYLGFGPSAHSFSEGKRYYYSRDLSDYIAHPGEHLLVEEEEVDRLEEYFAMGFRLRKGISVEECREVFHIPEEKLLKTAAPFLTHGLMKQEQGRLYLTPEGFLLSNSIITDFLLLEDELFPQK